LILQRICRIKEKKEQRKKNKEKRNVENKGRNDK